MMKKGLFIFLSVFLFGCSSPPVFEGTTAMDNNIWNRFNFLIFEVPVLENELLDFYLTVDFTEEYPWDELVTNITFYAPDGSMRSGDYTFPVNESSRISKGKQSHLFSIRKQMMFSTEGICEVRVENKSTKVRTPGISNIGLIARYSE